MSIFGDFRRDERGTSPRSIALAAGAISLAAVAGANLLDRAVRSGAIPHVAIVDNGTEVRFARNFSALPHAADGGARQLTQQVTVDFTPTSSIPSNLAQPIVLDPCTGARK
jgi:hypothetical protein